MLPIALIANLEDAIREGLRRVVLSVVDLVVLSA
jgi:hypothetical protein